MRSRSSGRAGRAPAAPRSSRAAARVRSGRTIGASWASRIDYTLRNTSGNPAVTGAVVRPARATDLPDAYRVCLATGNHGDDGEPLYRDDPDALGRIFVGPYLAFEPELGLVLEDAAGICGYALGAFDSRAFYARYEAEWRPNLCAMVEAP